MRQTKVKLPLSTVIGIAVIIAIIAGLVTFNNLYDGKFLNIRNLNSILIHAIIQTMIAWTFAFIFAAGFMDLSLGAVIVLAGFAAGELGNHFGYAGVLIGGLAAGITLMIINNLVFAYSKIPTWIAGLGLTMVYEGIGIAYSNQMIAAGTTVVLMKPEYTKLAFFPYVYILFAVSLFIVYIVYNRSTPGLNLRAIGGNARVTEAMGVNVNKTILQIALICGILIAFAGILNQSYSGRVFAKSGLTSLSMIFKPLATLLLAQVMERRINLVISMPICAVLIYMLFNILSIIGVASGTLQEAILGLCIIVIAAVAQREEKGVIK